jgi:hypothetical protein
MCGWLLLEEDPKAELEFTQIIRLSYAVPQENNVMLNPLHPDALRMVRQRRLVPFLYDRRLL